MRITFHGAARAVTGSMYLVEVGGRKLLLECGIHQGKREASEAQNRSLPFDPAGIEAMVLSHAHLDHSGNIPTLVKGGFAGRIAMTGATGDLLGIMLKDSAHIQASDLKTVNRRHQEAGLPPKEPLYTEEHVERALALFDTYPYDRPFSPMPGVTATFHDAGHILGSAMVELALTENGTTRTLFFTGDLGRKGMPIIRDPYQARKADYLMTESTYGDRVHGAFGDTVAKLERLVREVYQRRGKIVIPSFSVGRTQEIVYELHRMFNTGALPPMPIFVDSPLSANATEVFRAHPECFDEETVQLFGKEDDPFGFRRLTYVGSSEDSKKLNHIKEPCVIISASGMCEGGRILHHLANSLGDRRNMVLIVGFQAEGTLGRKLVEKRPSVRIFGQEHQVQAQVEVLNGFSAHADRNEIIDWVRSLGAVRRAFLVHGEEKQCLQLESSLQQLGVPATVPVLGQAEELT